MKKIYSIIASLLALFILASCGSTQINSDTPDIRIENTEKDCVPDSLVEIEVPQLFNINYNKNIKNYIIDDYNNANYVETIVEHHPDEAAHTDNVTLNVLCNYDYGKYVFATDITYQYDKSSDNWNKIMQTMDISESVVLNPECFIDCVIDNRQTGFRGKNSVDYYDYWVKIKSIDFDSQTINLDYNITAGYNDDNVWCLEWVSEQTEVFNLLFEDTFYSVDIPCGYTYENPDGTLGDCNYYLTIRFSPEGIVFRDVYLKYW